MTKENEIEVFGQWKGEIKWEDLENIATGIEVPSGPFVRRMAAELRKHIGPKEEEVKT